MDMHILYLKYISTFIPSKYRCMDISTNIIYLVDPPKLFSIKKNNISICSCKSTKKYENNQEIS